MANEIKFDFSKAQNVLDVLNECMRSVDELSYKLSDEVSNAGEWWKGESYDAFVEKYDKTGRGNSVIKGLSEKTADTINLLSKISEAKKSNENDLARMFK